MIADFELLLEHVCIKSGKYLKGKVLSLAWHLTILFVRLNSFWKLKALAEFGTMVASRSSPYTTILHKKQGFLFKLVVFSLWNKGTMSVISSLKINLACRRCDYLLSLKLYPHHHQLASGNFYHCVFECFAFVCRWQRHHLLWSPPGSLHSRKKGK